MPIVARWSVFLTSSACILDEKLVQIHQRLLPAAGRLEARIQSNTLHPHGGLTGSSSTTNWPTTKCGKSTRTCLGPRKRCFFCGKLGSRVPYVNTMDAHVEVDGETFYFWVSEKIVTNVIGEMLFDPNESDEKIENVLSFFERCDDGHHTESSVERKVTIKKVSAFRLVVEYVGAGLTFRQACHVLQATAAEAKISKLRGIREQDVSRIIRTVVGVNLQKISDLLRSEECWAYSIAFDGATIQGRSLIDVRVRFFANENIEKIHLIAIPLHGPRTGEAF
jgi:hypothetical protein